MVFKKCPDVVKIILSGRFCCEIYLFLVFYLKKKKQSYYLLIFVGYKKIKNYNNFFFTQNLLIKKIISRLALAKFSEFICEQIFSSSRI